MKTTNKKQLQRSISRRYTSLFFVYLVSFTLLYTGFFLFVYLVGNSVVWYASDFLYPVLSILNSNPLPVFFMGWILGALVIVLMLWRRTAKDIVALSDAIAAMNLNPGSTIQLPATLNEVQGYLRDIQVETLRNEQLAKEAEQRKNDLVVYLAHDLKTPLTSVLGYLTLLRDEEEISPQLQKKYIEIATGKAQRLEDLINEFFEITRFNLKGLVLENTTLNFSRMVEQVSSEFGPLFAPKGITCKLNIEPDLQLVADAGKLERVVDNLLRNATNYSYPKSEIEVAAWQQENFVYLRVHNKGDTIPPQKLTHIFEQFYRVGQARGSESGGSGLGLAIAKEIVERHGGQIYAQSENNTIEFTVMLPLQPALPPAQVS